MNREEELEVVTTAYFLEDRVSSLEGEIRSLNNTKPLPPPRPSEPVEEIGKAEVIPYPPIDPVVKLEKPRRTWPYGFGIFIAGMILANAGIFEALRIPEWVVIILLFLLLLLSPVITIRNGIKDSRINKKKLEELKAKRIEEIRNSPEYVQRCREIDAENERRQAQLDKELHEQYLRRYEQYKKDTAAYEQGEADYRLTVYPEWEKELELAQSALHETKEALAEVYSRNVLPAQYRNKSAVLYLSTFIGTSNYDLKYAIERFDDYVSRMQQREQINIAMAQLRVANEALQNQQYANWLSEQTLAIAERSNDTLKSISRWQKADLATREYRRFQARRKRHK